jgi:hypothetical protein
MIIENNLFSIDNSYMVIPIISYLNADTDKDKIISDNKNKSGVYRWINKKSGKSYIGSSINLSKRLYRYYSLKHIKVQSKSSIICNALLSGYSNLIFEILEYCNKEDCIIREQYYLNLLKPEYNILPTAGSLLGYKHSEESKDKMKGPRNLSLDHLTKIRNHINQLNSKRALIVEVFDVVNQTSTEYISIRETARELNSNDSTIRRYIKNNQIFLDRYKISLKKDK